jgi:hypothetical protein
MNVFKVWERIVDELGGPIMLYYYKGTNTPTQSQQRNKTTDEQIFSRRGVPGFLVQG